MNDKSQDNFDYSNYELRKEIRNLEYQITIRDKRIWNLQDKNKALKADIEILRAAFDRVTQTK